MPYSHHVLKRQLRRRGASWLSHFTLHLPIMLGWSRPKSGKMKRTQRRKKKREYQPLELWEAENEEVERPADTPAEHSTEEEEAAGEAVAAEPIAARRVLQANAHSFLPAEPTEAITMNSFTTAQYCKQAAQTIECSHSNHECVPLRCFKRNRPASMCTS